MKVLCFFALAAVAFAVDPTTVCLPDRFAVEVYDTSKMEVGISAVDFKKNMAASVLSRSGGKILDFNNKFQYLVSLDGLCTRLPLDVAQTPVHQCLPANAQQTLASNYFALGLGSETMTIQTWEVAYSSTFRARFGLTIGNPVYPVMRQVILNDKDGGTQVFYNPIETVNATMFVIPSSCPT